MALSGRIAPSGLLSLFLLCVACGSDSAERLPAGIEEGHKLDPVIEGFHIYSYYAGIAFCAAEFVSYGCKNLALSPTYSEEELEVVLEPTRMAAEEYGIPIYVERDFLTTLLFDPSITEEKVVIVMTYDQQVLDEYLELKEFKKRAVEEGRLEEVEEEIARRFGRLLSYNDETIERLIATNRG